MGIICTEREAKNALREVFDRKGPVERRVLRRLKFHFKIDILNAIQTIGVRGLRKRALDRGEWGYCCSRICLITSCNSNNDDDNILTARRHRTVTNLVAVLNHLFLINRYKTLWNIKRDYSEHLWNILRPIPKGTFWPVTTSGPITMSLNSGKLSEDWILMHTAMNSYKWNVESLNFEYHFSLYTILTG